MELFGFLDLYGLAFAAVLAVPHIIFARRYKTDLSRVGNKAMIYIERAGKYASLFLMFVNIGVLELGFTSDYMKTYWIYSTLAMCAVYILLWAIFFKRQRLLWANLVTILGSLAVIQSGLLMQKTLLLTAGIVYLAGRLYLNGKIYKG